MLEDLDFYCVDNIRRDCCTPSSSTRSARASPPTSARPSVSTRATARGPGRLCRLVDELRSGGSAARSSSCAPRTRRCSRVQRDARRHPCRGPVSVSRKRSSRSSVCSRPSPMPPIFTIDTSRLSVHELRELIRNASSSARRAGVAAVPVVRVSAWRTRRCRLRFRRALAAEPVLELRAARPDRARRGGRRVPRCAAGGAEFQADLIAFLERWLPSLVRSNRSYLTVAVGCTGGQHRSVHLAERLAAHFQGHIGPALIRHRDLASRRHE